MGHHRCLLHQPSTFHMGKYNLDGRSCFLTATQAACVHVQLSTASPLHVYSKAFSLLQAAAHSKYPSEPLGSTSATPASSCTIFGNATLSKKLIWPDFCYCIFLCLSRKKKTLRTKIYKTLLNVVQSKF